MRTMRYLSFFLAMTVVSGQESPRLCGTVVGLFPIDFQYKTPESQLARVEVRQCFEDLSEAIQIVAWSSHAGEPDLVVDTTDFALFSSVFRSNVVIIETIGATRDQVYAVVYEKGKPHLALRRSTKGSASVTLKERSLHLVIPDIYAGDAPPRTEEHDFKLARVNEKP